MTTEHSSLEPPTSHVIERLRERDVLVGWQFESHSDITDTWTTVTTLDSQLTEAELHEQHGQLRELTPLVPLDTVITLPNNDGHAAAVSTTVLDPPPHTDTHAGNQPQHRATTPPAATNTVGDTYE